MSFISTLENWDVNLFFRINGAHSPFMDVFMEFVSGKAVWIPAYILLAFLLYKLGGWKTLGAGLIGVGILMLWCDTGSVHLFKNVFLRYRPCHNIDYGSQVHIVNNHCGGQYGFISSHAANFFGLAMYFSLIFYSRWKRSWMILFLCAIIVGYSRIYLGVHYPSDVTVGALYGIAGGIVCRMIYILLMKKLFNRKKL